MFHQHLNKSLDQGECMESESAVLDEVLGEEDVVPFGFLFAEEMTAPTEIIADPNLLHIYASATYTTHTPQGPDDPVDDTER